jgi:cysteine-rich repeat protein
MGVGAGFQGARCGSGTVDDPEACDDGNLVGGDGCSAACAIEPCWGCAGEPSVCTPLAAGSACSDDNPCTDDACDGAGACAHVNNMEPCGDGVCETGACSGGTCVLTFDPPGTPCDNDGNLCTLDFCSNGGGGGGVCIGGPPLDCSPCGTCDPALGCVPQPSPVCQAGLAGSSVELRTDADPARRKITWRWRGTGPSAADFGNPPLVSDYDVCVYLGPPGLATTTLTARAPAGGTCGGHGDSCWRATKSGYSYRDRDATPDGLTALKLSSRSPGSATISLKGKGQNLRLPPALQAGTDVTALVELRRTGGAGQCWSTEISPSTSTAARFKGKTK